MKSVSIPAVMMASVCIYIGIYYLWLFIKSRTQLVNLTLSLTCFTIALYDFFSAGLYNSDSVAEGIIWQKLQFSSLALASLSMSWFIFYFTRYKSKKIFNLSSIFFSIFFLLGIFVQNDLTLSVNNPKIKHVTLGGLVNIRYYEADPGIIYVIQFIFMLLLSIGVVYFTIQHYLYYKDDNNKNTGPIVISLIAFFLGVLNDILVGLGIYPFIYLFEYASFIIIISMAYLLINEFIELNNEAIEFNKMLKEKIDKTTMELLFSNIGKELYRETLNELFTDEMKSSPAVMKRMSSYDSGTSINKISQDMSIVSNMDDLLNAAIKKTVEICGAEQGAFYLAGKKNRPLLKAFYNTSDALYKEVDESLFQRIFREETSHITLSDDDPPKSVLSVPVKLDDELLGIAYLKKNLTDSPFTNQDADITSVFLAQSAKALENAFFYQRMKNISQEKVRSQLTATSEEKIKRAIQYIEDNYMYDISRENLAASIDMHPDSLSRYFKIFTGKKLGDYLNEIRVNYAAAKLKETDDNIIDVAFSVGFESLTSFNRAFLKFMDTTPKKYRTG